MDWVEQGLKQALARKDAPDGFAQRVSWSARRPRFYLARRVAAAAALVVVAGGSIAWREHQGRLAKEQVMTAMRMTSAKLRHIQGRVREVRQ
jgi:hypothetical protein